MGTRPPAEFIDEYGITCMCLCIILAPALKPELKNMNASIDVIVIIAALKSSMSRGSIYFWNSFGTTITCLSQTENLLNMRLWVSVSSSINDPFSKGGTKGSF